MPKVLTKKFEHKPKESRASQYDWDLILGGQNVQLDVGTDYPAETHKKDGTKGDGTESFIRRVESKADDLNKKVLITRLNSEGKVHQKGQPVSGIVVTAAAMTAEEIATRDARRAELAKKRAESEKNGEQTAAPAEASEGIPL